MANERFDKGAGLAAEVCRRFALGEAGRAVLRPELAPRPFVERLAEAGLFDDAFRFLAHALPRREAVWWACQCFRHGVAGLPAPPPAPQLAAVQAAERWSAAPTEDHRRAAFAAAEAADFGNPAGCAALAAFLSGGS